MSARNDTIEQIDGLQQVQTAKRSRLSVLHVQAAQYGNDAPPHITNEIKSITGELVQISLELAKLERAIRQDALRSSDDLPTAESLRPISVVPASINENFYALAGAFQAFTSATEKQFRALQLAVYKESEDRQRDNEMTRDVIKEERNERRGARDEDNDVHHGRHKELARWIWVLGLALLLLFVAFVLYASNQYLRELYAGGIR